MGSVVAVTRPLRWLVISALASAGPACASQLAHGQRSPAAARPGAAPSGAGAPVAAKIEGPAATEPPAEDAPPPAAPDVPPVATPAALVAPPAAAMIEDPSGRALAAFHAALRRAQAGQGQARIAFYGASHVASDLFTGPVRQRLQREFGEAGPGFVQLGKPWRWYRHAGIRVEQSRNLRPFRIRARAPIDGIYGLAGVALDARPGKPARAVIATRANGGLSGHVAEVELWYLKQPGGGRIHLFLDGERKQRIETHAKRAEPAYVRYELEDGPHRIELRTSGTGPVRVFGAVLERDVPGVILDTLGVPGTRARDHLYWDDAVYREHLAKRRPDLVVLAYGTNESGDDDVPIEAYEARLTRVLTRVREIAPQASCMLIGPSDRPLRLDDGTFADRPLTLAVIASQRKLAREFGCGFVDVQRFMGGPLSMLRWVESDPPLASKDYVHFTALGYERFAESLHAALLSGFEPAGEPAIAETPVALPEPEPAAEPSPPAPPVPVEPPAGDGAHELPRALK